jgi:hypothetical protein
MQAGIACLAERVEPMDATAIGSSGCAVFRSPGWANARGRRGGRGRELCSPRASPTYSALADWFPGAVYPAGRPGA